MSFPVVREFVRIEVRWQIPLTFLFFLFLVFLLYVVSPVWR